MHRCFSKGRRISREREKKNTEKRTRSFLRLELQTGETVTIELALSAFSFFFFSFFFFPFFHFSLLCLVYLCQPPMS